jgi:tetraacyldisaccharide 4'-kinase
MADRPGNGEADEGPDRLGASGVVQRVWEREGGAAERTVAALLVPAELAYRGAVRARNAAYRSGLLDTDAPPIPTISVGNITVGGTGKTPVVRWLVQRLVARGFTPGILHGGYADDEPELHRRFGRDLDIVLVAAESWARDARLLPRGPYRESPLALRRADLVIVTRRTADPEVAVRTEHDVARISGSPTARIHLRPAGWLDGRFQDREGAPPGPALAVAGVGRPDDFFDQAEDAGAQLADAVAFPDHHPYTRAEATALLEEAAGRPLVMTAKDAVKLAPWLAGSDLWVLEQVVAFESGRDRVLRRVDEVVS